MDANVLEARSDEFRESVLDKRKITTQTAEKIYEECMLKYEGFFGS